MQMAFDVISDLHLDTYPEEFDWTGQATSPHCILIGDVCADRLLLYKTLAHLGRCYQAVFYIDGNDEHLDRYDDLGQSYKELAKRISMINNVVYLQDNVVIVNGVAILGTNGWWGFDFDSDNDVDLVREWWCDHYGLTYANFKTIRRASAIDANYMAASIERLQTHQDVQKIIVVTHTVPSPVLIAHDPDLAGKFKFNVMGNKKLIDALTKDTENKVHTWCFGHYHGKVDQIHNGVRFVNNCRGRSNTLWSQYVYHPLRITLDV